jgi:hypothetical protein
LFLLFSVVCHLPFSPTAHRLRKLIPNFPIL